MREGEEDSVCDKRQVVEVKMKEDDRNEVGKDVEEGRMTKLKSFVVENGGIKTLAEDFKERQTDRPQYRQRENYTNTRLKINNVEID